SVGMAPNIYYSKLNIHNLILLAPGIETIGKMEVDGYTFGGTFGLLYRQNNYSIGVKYQTPFEIRYKGNFDLHNIGSFNAETKINFPERYGIGVCFYPVEKIKMEFDVEHFKFSSLKSIFINPGFISPYEVQKNWKDVYNFYFGTEYRKSKNLKIRGGIAKLNSPIPESTWEPSLPDADTIILTGGTEIKTRFGFFEFTILISNPKEIKKEDRNYGGNFKSEGFFFTIGFKREF
ncbi:MAG: outer membrane protein transport protein, partial [bacterium]|nr:outer membrane protein transport protein [bacterium]